MRIVFDYESCCAVLELHDFKYATLSSLRSGVRNQGHATEVMKKIVEYADKHNLGLFLTVQAYGPPDILNNNQLESFYKKFGFEISPTGPKNRKPKQMIRMRRRKYTPLNEKQTDSGR